MIFETKWVKIPENGGKKKQFIKRYTFDRVGDVFEGTYIRSEKDEYSHYENVVDHIFRGGDGQLVKIWGTASLNARFGDGKNKGKIDPNTRVRIIWLGGGDEVREGQFSKRNYDVEAAVEEEDER